MAEGDATCTRADGSNGSARFEDEGALATIGRAWVRAEMVGLVPVVLAIEVAGPAERFSVADAIGMLSSEMDRLAETADPDRLIGSEPLEGICAPELDCAERKDAWLIKVRG